MTQTVQNFEGKTVTLTGAGGIIISSIAKGFAAAGANVALLDLNLEAAEKVAEEINAQGKGKAKGYKANVLDKEALEAVKAQIDSDLGPTDILVNGAGGNSPKATSDNEFHEADLADDVKTFFDLDEEGISFVFNLNFLGTLLPTQVFAKDMVGREGANIINVSSMNAFTPLTKIPAYSGAKAAISNFTEWLAVHFSKVGIRVNAIAPGFLVSHQNIDLLYEEDHETLRPRGEKIIRNTPMERFGEAEEMVGPTLFFADSDQASFVTGVVLPVDGGFSAYSGV